MWKEWAYLAFVEMLDYNQKVLIISKNYSMYIKKSPLPGKEGASTKTNCLKISSQYYASWELYMIRNKRNYVEFRKQTVVNKTPYSQIVFKSTEIDYLLV
jgi:hypothetical protein